jgi:hypothetical protein
LNASVRNDKLQDVTLHSAPNEHIQPSDTFVLDYEIPKMNGIEVTCIVAPTSMILESLGSRFHLRLEDRANAANILAAALLDKLKKDEKQETIVLGIPRGGVVVADIIANKQLERVHSPPTMPLR